MLVDSYGKVVKAIVQEHEAAPFEPTTHAECIVKYFLKKCGVKRCDAYNRVYIASFYASGRGEERSNEARIDFWSEA